MKEGKAVIALSDKDEWAGSVISKPGKGNMWPTQDLSYLLISGRVASLQPSRKESLNCQEQNILTLRSWPYNRTAVMKINSELGMNL
jgi:hypothetical protein